MPTSDITATMGIPYSYLVGPTSITANSWNSVVSIILDIKRHTQ